MTLNQKRLLWKQKGWDAYQEGSLAKNNPLAYVDRRRTPEQTIRRICRDSWASGWRIAELQLPRPTKANQRDC